MDEQTTKRKGFSALPLLFLILAIVVIWWFWRQNKSDDVASSAETDAEIAAATDPDDILVDLRDDNTPDQIASIESSLNIKLSLVDNSGEAAQTKLYRAHVDPARRDAILAALSARPDVEIAEPDAEIKLSPEELAPVEPIEAEHEGFPNDPMYGKQWNLRQIGMPEAWKLADGNGVIVAVLDTGVAFEDYKNFHVLEDLKGLTFVKPYDFVRDNVHANDDHGHGSHVTGTIAQMTNNGKGVAGVALNVRIMPLKVLSGSGSGSVAGIADAIRYAADNGAKVINMSLGGAFPSKVLKKAVEYAHGKGVTVVCAAGNESRGKVGYPAAYPGAIAVSATRGDEAITFYSNWGKDIDVAAPGGDTTDGNGNRNNPDGGVLQNTIKIQDPTVEGYYAYMGTSMASPHVAGVAALVVGAGVTNPDEVEKVLKETARKPEKQNYNVEKYGAGIINAPAAIKKAKALVAGEDSVATNDDHTDDHSDHSADTADHSDAAVTATSTPEDTKPDLKTGALTLMLGLGLAGLVAMRRNRLPLGATYIAGVVIGATGLFFLPAILPSVAALPVIHTLTHPFAAWLGTGTLLFVMALVPLALLVLVFDRPKLKVPLVGVAVGTAAHLALLAVAAGSSLSGAWFAANAIACLVLARLAIRR